MDQRHAGAAGNVTQNKIKHFLGFVHSLAWLVLYPFIANDSESVEEGTKLVDKLLLFSISYFLQDCIWSIRLKEYAILLHHICTIMLFVGLFGKSNIEVRSSLISVSMFWCEIGALFIHVKFLLSQSAVAHHACYVVYFLTRILVYPTIALPTIYRACLNGKASQLKELYSGMALAIFVYIFSLCCVIAKFSSFRDSCISATTCNCRIQKDRNKKKI